MKFSIVPLLTILLSLSLGYDVLSQEWYPIYTELEDVNLRDVNFPIGETQSAWIVGDRGIILRTRDGGVTWQEQASPTDKNLYSVYFIDNTNGWAVGDNGTIIQTKDGSNWQPVSSPAGGRRLRCVNFYGFNNGWAVGDLGTILYWNGIEWKKQESPTTQHLYAVDFINNSEGWAVGDSGTILYTNNGGNKWEKIPSGATNILRGVYFVNSNNGWIIGDGIILHKYGEGFERQSIDTKYILYDIDFISDVQGWISASAGIDRVLFKTTNGGRNWEIQRPPYFKGDLYGIDFISADSALAVGGKGTIIRYTKNPPKLELELLSPSGNINTLKPEFKWKSTRPDILLKIYISRGDDPFQSPTQLVYAPIEIANQTSYKLPEGYYIPHGTYTWGIEAVDGTRAKPLQFLQFTTWSETEITIIGPNDYIKEDTPTFEWRWLETADYTLYIDSDSDPFDGKSINVGKNMKYTITSTDPIQKLREGKYFWGVIGNENGKAIKSTVMAFIVDLSPPIGTIEIDNGAKAINSLNVTLKLSASDPLVSGGITGSGVVEMQLSNNGLIWTDPEPFTGARTLTWDLSKYGGNDKDGKKTVYVRYKDALEHWSESIKAEIILDRVPPTGTILINNGDEFTGSKIVTLTLKVTDEGSGMTPGGLIRLRNSPGNWSDPLPYESPRTWDLTAYGGDEKEGIKTVYVKYRDIAGNWMTQEQQDSIKLDKTGPKGSIKINDGATETKSLLVKLTLSATDESGVKQMQFTNGSGIWSPLEPYNTERENWNLAEYGGNANDGIKKVYVRFVDSVGNLTQPAIEASIIYKSSVRITDLKISAPKVEGKIKDGDIVQVSGKTEPNIELFKKELLDENDKILSVDLSNITHDIITGQIKGSFTVNRLSAKSIRLRLAVKDNLGNSADAVSNSLSIDNDPPTNISINIDRKGASSDMPTNSTFVTVNLSATGATEMYVDGDIETVYDIPSGLRNWAPFTSVLKLKLRDRDGVKTVKVKFRDELGNTSPEVSDQITLDTTSPTGTITINNGEKLTNSFMVKLKLSATDKSGIEFYQLSNDGNTWIDPTIYSEAEIDWDLRRFGGNTSDGTKKVYVKYKDKAGNWSAPISSSIEIDTTPPNIAHTPIADKQEETKPVIITAIVQDTRLLTSVNLYYRKKGTVEYTVVDMRKLSGDYYTAQIPGEMVTSAGLEYYISASDGLQISTNPIKNAPIVPHSFTVVDTIPPNIQHEPITSVSVKSSPKIIAKVNDAVKVSKVNLFYRVNTENEFKKIEMVGDKDEYSANIPALELPGVVRYYIQAIDSSSNSRTLPENGAKQPYIISFVDLNPPVIIHTPIPDGQEAGKSVSIGATITDDVIVEKVIFKYKVTGKDEFVEVKMTNVGSFYKAEIPGNVLMPGKVDYTITASDASTMSKDTQISHSFTVIDTTAPKIELTLAPSRVEVNKEISIQADVTDNVKVQNVVLYYKNVDDTKFNIMDMKNLGTKYSAIIAGQKQIGEFKYYIHAKDSSGNISTLPAVDPENAPNIITVFDISKPIIYHTPITGAQEAGLPVTITATVTDDVKVTEVTLHYRSAGQESFKIAQMIETGTKSLYGGSIPASDVIPTGVEYYIKAIDNSFNVTTHPLTNPDKLPHSFSVVDTLPPEIIYDPSKLTKVLVTEQIIIRAEATDRTGIKEVRVFYKHETDNNFKMIICKYESKNKYIAEIPLPLAKSNVYYYIQAEDNSGNVNTSPKDIKQPYSVFVDDPFPPDPPTKLTALSLPGGKIKLTWEFSKSVDTGKYNIYTDSGSGTVDYSSVYAFVNSTRNSWESGVLGEGTYKFSVRAVDKSGNEENNTVTVSVIADSIKPEPVTNLTAKSIAGGRIELNWTLSLSKDAYVYNIYWDNAQADINFSNALARVNDPETKWVSDKLRDGVVYRFVVRCQDRSGNEDESFNIVSARADGIPPENVTELSSSTHKVGVWSNQTKITVRWSSSVDNISGLDGYSISWDTQERTIPDEIIDIKDPSTTQITYETTDLLKQGYAVVYFHIRPVDKAGNWNNSASHLGPFMIDNQPPEPPLKLNSRPVSGGKIELSWAPSISDDVVKYNIYWDNGTGVNIDYAKAITSVIKDPVSSKNPIWISSVLQDGKEYKFSVRAEDRAGNEEKNVITVSSISDSQPPTIAHKPIIALLEEENMSVTIYANVDDASGLDKVTLHYRKRGDSKYLEKEMVKEPGNLYKADIPSSVFSSAGVDYYISAIDVAGNIATYPVTTIAIVKSLQVTLDPSKENEIILGDGSLLYIPAGAVPANTQLSISIPRVIPPPQVGLKKHIIAREFSLDKNLLKPITITLHYNDSNVIDEDETKLAIYLWDGKIWNYLAKVSPNENSATAVTMKWGIFSIIGDYEPPMIHDLKPSEYAGNSSRIIASIKDNGSGIDPESIEVILDGSKIELPSREVKDGIFWLNIPIQLTNGHHTLQVIAKDYLDNTNKAESSFEVTGKLTLRDVFCYPNPFSPSVGTNFVYTLTESATDVIIRVFSIDGKLVRKIDGSLNVGKNVVSWDGEDEFGDAVLNSVYICQIEAKGSRGSVTEIIKIAGWEK